MANFSKLGALRGALAQPTRRHFGFLLLWLLSLVFFFAPIRSLVSLAVQDERYSYILAIPLISAFVVWLGKEKIFSKEPQVGSSWLPLILTGMILGFTVWGGSSLLGPGTSLSLSILAVILVWTGGFSFCYGTQTLVAAIFPAVLLLLMIPLPASAMDSIVLFFQQGSAEMTDRLFRIVGVPFLRDGFRFSLPSVDIEIAKECSGIHSSSSLFVCSLLVGYLFIRTSWRRACFVLLTIPVVIFKNAIRIVTISWLGIYVDRDFLTGYLHHRGGWVFSIPALVMMGAVLWALRKSEAFPKACASSQLRPEPAAAD